MFEEVRDAFEEVSKRIIAGADASRSLT